MGVGLWGFMLWGFIPEKFSLTSTPTHMGLFGGLHILTLLDRDKRSKLGITSSANPFSLP